MSAVNSFLESITPESLFEDPYPIYARLRREAPVAYLPQMQMYAVTRYDDVAEIAAMKEPWVATDSQHALRRTLGDPVITMVDGDVHDDLRVGIDKTMRPRPIT